MFVAAHQYDRLAISNPRYTEGMDHQIDARSDPTASKYDSIVLTGIDALSNEVSRLLSEPRGLQGGYGGGGMGVCIPRKNLF